MLCFLLCQRNCISAVVFILIDPILSTLFILLPRFKLKNLDFGAHGNTPPSWKIQLQSQLKSKIGTEIQRVKIAQETYFRITLPSSPFFVFLQTYNKLLFFLIFW